MEDYRSVPIEKYGLAMLRGMGWDPTKGIGKSQKLVSPVEPKIRPRGMGLGVAMDKIDKPCTDDKHTKSNEEELKITKGSFVEVVSGDSKHLYGQVEGFNEESGRLIVKIAISSSIVSVNEYMVKLVSKTDYDKNSRVINVSKYEQYKEKENKNAQVHKPLKVSAEKCVLKSSAGTRETPKHESPITEGKNRSHKLMKSEDKYSSQVTEGKNRSHKLMKCEDKYSSQNPAKFLKDEGEVKSLDNLPMGYRTPNTPPGKKSSNYLQENAKINESPSSKLTAKTSSVIDQLSAKTKRARSSTERSSSRDSCSSSSEEKHSSRPRTIGYKRARSPSRSNVGKRKVSPVRIRKRSRSQANRRRSDYSSAESRKKSHSRSNRRRSDYSPAESRKKSHSRSYRRRNDHSPVQSRKRSRSRSNGRRSDSSSVDSRSSSSESYGRRNDYSSVESKKRSSSRSSESRSDYSSVDSRSSRSRSYKHRYDYSPVESRKKSSSQSLKRKSDRSSVDIRKSSRRIRRRSHDSLLRCKRSICRTLLPKIVSPTSSSHKKSDSRKLPKSDTKHPSNRGDSVNNSKRSSEHSRVLSKDSFSQKSKTVYLHKTAKKNKSAKSSAKLSSEYY